MNSRWIQNFHPPTCPVGKRNNKLIFTSVISLASEYGRHLCVQVSGVFSPHPPPRFSCNTLSTPSSADVRNGWAGRGGRSDRVRRDRVSRERGEQWDGVYFQIQLMFRPAFVQNQPLLKTRCCSKSATFQNQPSTVQKSCCCSKQLLFIPAAVQNQLLFKATVIFTSCCLKPSSWFALFAILMNFRNQAAIFARLMSCRKDNKES